MSRLETNLKWFEVEIVLYSILNEFCFALMKKKNPHFPTDRKYGKYL